MSPEQLLGELSGNGDSDRIVICDLEGGINTLFRVREGFLDRVLVLCEPTLKSIETTERVLAMADRHGFESLVLANRIADPADAEMIRRRFPERHIVEIPEDAGIAQADRLGVAPIDHAPESAAVGAIVELAGSMIR